MTQVSVFATPNNRSERFNFQQEITDVPNNDIREKSYELLSEFNQKSIGSDSFNSGHSSRASRKSDLKSLKGKRFIAKLTRSATNSPRIEYNSSSFLEYVKMKMPLLGNIPPYTQDEREHELQFKNPLQDIENLENEWKSFKNQHNFESRGSLSPNRSQLGLDNSSVSKPTLLQAIRRNRHEDINIPSKKTNDKNTAPMSNLLSKVIPQAKINLVQPSLMKPHNRFGVNHSKSLEPKKDSSRENCPSDRLKKNDPLKAIYDKYSNINRKKESYEDKSQISLPDRAISHHSVQSLENWHNERNSCHQENESNRCDRRIASPSLFIHGESKIHKPLSGIPLSTNSDARQTLKDPQVILDLSLKEHERSPRRLYDPKRSVFSGNEEHTKGAFLDKSAKSVDRLSLYSATNPFEIQSIEELDVKKGQYFQATNKNDAAKSKLFYYETNYKEEQESLFNVPATAERSLNTQKSVSPKKASLNLVRSIKIHTNNKQEVYPAEKLDHHNFGSVDERENKLKESLRIMKDEIKKVLDEKELLTDVDEELEPQMLKKQANDLSIQKPFHFFTRESNFSPSKKKTPDNNTNLKFKKENPFKQECKYSPGGSKQRNSISLKQMPKEKPVEALGYLKEKGVNIASFQAINSSRPKVESISLKTEFVTLESARLQKHKLMTLTSATKSAIICESRAAREGNPFYFLATQEDNTKEPNTDYIKVRNKRSQNLDPSKSFLSKKGDENILKHKSSMENEGNINRKVSERTKRNKPRILKVRK